MAYDTADKARATSTAAGRWTLTDVYGRVIANGEATSFKEFVRQTAAKLSLACVDLSGANLEGIDLSGADLRGASLHGADLDGAILSGATLAGADLREASLRDASLDNAALERASLDGANLAGARIDTEDLPSGYTIRPGGVAAVVDGATPEGERTRGRHEDDERHYEACLRALVGRRVLVHFARLQAATPEGVERDRVRELGRLVCEHVRSGASGELLKRHRSDDGHAITVAAGRSDPRIRRFLRDVVAATRRADAPAYARQPEIARSQTEA